MPNYYQGTHTGAEVDAGLDIILSSDRGIDALPEATDADHLLGVENGAAKKVAVSALQRDALEAFVKEKKNGDYYERPTLSGTETGNEVKFSMGADRIPMKELDVTVLRGQVQTLSVTVEPETIRINQQVPNGNFTSTSGWSAPRGSLTASGGVLTYKITAVGSGFDENRAEPDANMRWVNGHKFYVTADVKFSIAGGTFRIGRTASNNFVSVSCPNADVWYRASGIFSSTSTTNAKLWCMWSNAHSIASVNDTMQLANVMVIDLTAIFGAGNEPADASAVRALLPNDYYAYALDTPLSRLHGQTAYGDYAGQTYTIDLPDVPELGADLTWYVTDGKLYDNESGDVYDVPKKTVTTFLGYNRIFSVNGENDDPTVGGITAEIRLDPTLAYNAITNAIVALGGNV